MPEFDEERGPSREEYFAVGIVGTMLYSLVILSGLLGLNLNAPLPISKYFSLAVVCLGIAELPRYAVMVDRKEYTSSYAYGAHMIGEALYFIVLAIVIVRWITILNLTKQARLYRAAEALLFTNMTFSIVAVAIAIYVVESRDLDGIFFDSPEFSAYNILENVYNIFYSTLLTALGFRIRAL
jgi:hypothetical protein